MENFIFCAVNVEFKETEIAKTSNDYFLDIVKNLEIPEYKCEDDPHNQLSGSPVLQATMKYRNHQSLTIFAASRNIIQVFISH